MGPGIRHGVADPQLGRGFATHRGTVAMYAILEYPNGPAISVGYRTLAAAEAALDRLRGDDARYSSSVVASTDEDV
jgi:hypothetical protein